MPPMPTTWTEQCPIDLTKLTNLLTSVETYLRPRAQTPHQRTIVGQITYLRQHLQTFSADPLPSRRPSGRHKKQLRTRVLERDCYRCTHCGTTTNLEMHHLIPLSQGGTNHLDNLTTLCHTCHTTLH